MFAPADSFGPLRIIEIEFLPVVGLFLRAHPGGVSDHELGAFLVESKFEDGHHARLVRNRIQAPNGDDVVAFPDLSRDFLVRGLVIILRVDNFFAIDIDDRIVIRRDAQQGFLRPGLDAKDLPEKTHLVGLDGGAFIIVPDPIGIGGAERAGEQH